MSSDTSLDTFDSFTDQQRAATSRKHTKLDQNFPITKLGYKSKIHAYDQSKPAPQKALVRQKL